MLITIARFAGPTAEHPRSVLVPPPWSNAILRILAFLAVYGCATVWLTWPLAEDPFHNLPCPNKACSYDTTYSAWVLAWESHALGTPGARIANANIYYPSEDALYYGPAGFGALPYFLPTFLITGNAGFATNMMLLLSAALCALSLHWVVRRWTGLESAGLVAGAMLLLHPWYLRGFIAATPHLAPLVYFPLIAFLAATQGQRLRTALLLAVLIVAQCLTDPVYVAGAVVAPLGLLSVSRLARRRSRRDGLVLAGVLVASLACLIPFLLGYLRVRAENPGLAEQTPWPNAMTPTYLPSILWRGNAPTTIAPAALLVIAIGLALLARRAWARRPLPHDPGWRHGALWLIVGTVISLTPTVRWGGQLIHLPQYLLDASTPLYEIIRVPQRLGVAVLIGACLLSGVAFAEIAGGLARTPARRLGERALPGLLAVVMLALLYAVPAPNTPSARESYKLRKLPTIPPAVLAALQREAGPVVALPAMFPYRRWANPQAAADFMYLSTFHWRPLLNGYSSYWPEGFVERMKLAERLPDPAAVRSLVEAGVRTIWLNLEAYPPRWRERWRAVRVGLVPGLEVRAREKGQLVIHIDPSFFGGVPDGRPPA